MVSCGQLFSLVLPALSPFHGETSPHPLFLVMTRQPQLFPLQLGIELEKWEVVKSHSLEAELSSPHIHHLLSPRPLDLDV